MKTDQFIKTGAARNIFWKQNSKKKIEGGIFRTTTHVFRIVIHMVESTRESLTYASGSEAANPQKKNAEKRSGNHIEYVDGITIYAVVRDTGRGPTNLAHSSGSYIIAAIKNPSRFMDVTYPPDGYGIDAYRDVHRSLFFLSASKSMRKQLIYSAAVSIAARSRPWHENPSLRPDPGRRVRTMRRESKYRGPSALIGIPSLTALISREGPAFRSWTGAFEADPLSRRTIVKLSNGVHGDSGADDILM